jgi:HEPN domain-containing protein
MSHEQKDYIKKWFEIAEHDMEAAQLIIEMKPLILDIACFHCQQAIEKYLKAFLVYNNKVIERTHNLNLLQEQCSEIDRDFENYYLNKINEFSVNVRYPDEYFLPDLEEANDYYSLVLEVQKLVVGKINLE